ncbi:uncharacterized protein SAPINGB_P006420 [Magnusiomyces paraingens]|uniref:Protein N-terminal and lysine N-methyltransferase EFM7 n=1 Tax=Magnusiomyces paraingens TaxID=2606893 RepID=A0A5E8C4W2_9ASCO|nr:uncharacterized protein SAPINGB_P006420 [Saprochaete ingens]VVT58859.1 unnamed protein product [Saprochaete ingens]
MSAAATPTFMSHNNSSSTSLESPSDFMTDIFAEPSDFASAEPEPTYIDFHRTAAFVRPGEPQTINLRLVGKSPLWGHLLWNAGKLTTDYIDEHRDELVTGRNVLELGAAAALPSLVAALSAKNVVVTDYPDPELIENIQYNTQNAGLSDKDVSKLKVKGYIWGNDVNDLLALINDEESIPKEEKEDENTRTYTDDEKFDFLILSDLIFNHSEHLKLVATMDKALKPDGTALVVFSPHRPKLYHKDLEFFDVAKKYANFEIVDKFQRDYMPMFEEDEETRELRGKAFGYILKRAKE